MVQCLGNGAGNEAVTEAQSYAEEKGSGVNALEQAVALRERGAREELQAIGSRIGYGRAQQILGELWGDLLEKEYQAPRIRGKMGITTQDGLIPVFQVGDLVESTDEGYPLRSGSEWYPIAVVIQVSPLVLVSEESDMRWETTVKPDKLAVVGKADKKTLKTCLRRLDK